MSIRARMNPLSQSATISAAPQVRLRVATPRFHSFPLSCQEKSLATMTTASAFYRLHLHIIDRKLADRPVQAHTQNCAASFRGNGDPF